MEQHEDQASPAIGDLENETVFVPDPEHADPDAEAQMRMGRAYVHPENDLRDPWFHTDEGRAWLAEQGEES